MKNPYSQVPASPARSSLFLLLYRWSDLAQGRVSPVGSRFLISKLGRAKGMCSALAKMIRLLAGEMGMVIRDTKAPPRGRSSLFISGSEPKVCGASAQCEPNAAAVSNFARSSAFEFAQPEVTTPGTCLAVCCGCSPWNA